MGGTPRWVIADESSASTTPHDTAFVPGKSLQFTTIKGFPWSWMGFVSLFLSLSNHMIMYLCESVTATLLTTMCLEVLHSSAPKVNIA
jgi:hypothetical protein